MKSTLTLIAVLFLGFTVSGCNTMQGVGKDIKAGGSKLEKSAEKHKD